jgi:hypothetical protein
VAESVFSEARLRGYKVLSDARLGDAVELLILNLRIAKHLWLPLSLIELAFRNYADAALTAHHPRGSNWLLDKAHSGPLVAAELRGPQAFNGKGDDGTTEDPIVTAARMASHHLGRNEISRDDLIAHLMFGFWVVRVPRALEIERVAIDVFQLVADELSPPFDEGSTLRETLEDEVLPLRNRVAHHEAVLFRAKHVFAKKTGLPKTGADLITSLISRVAKFHEQVELVATTATAMAPMASDHLDGVPGSVRADLEPLEQLLAERRDELRRFTEERRAAKRTD